MLKRIIPLAALLFFGAGCADEVREERTLIERAEDRYEEAAEWAKKAVEEGSEEVWIEADEARERAEEAWERAADARARLSENRRRRLDEDWAEAREAREEALEAWDEAAEVFDRQFGDAMREFGEKIRRLGDAFRDEGGVEPVDWRKLEDLLPRRVAGMKRVDAEGEKVGALGIRLSKVTAAYEGDDREMELTIVDLGTLRRAAMTGLDWLDLEIDREGNRGYERTRTIEGFPAHEKFEREGAWKKFEMTVVVGERFVVSVEAKGRDLDEGDLDDLRGVIDYDDLDAMKHIGM
jgi:tetratricopeptide (TPR) repeat protein